MRRLFPSRRTLLVVFRLAPTIAMTACTEREVGELDCVPQVPDKVTFARFGGPCDLSRGSLGVSIEEGCIQRYACDEGQWTGIDGGACRSWSITPAEGSGGAAWCPPGCLADHDPATPGLEPACTLIVASHAGSGVEIGIDPCQHTEDGWTVPPGATVCVVVTTLDAINGPPLDTACVALGLNAGFELLGDFASVAPPDWDLSIACADELYPSEPCPGAEQRTDPLLCE